MPSGHKAFLVHNPKDVELLLMHNRTYAAEYVVHRDERGCYRRPNRSILQRE
jgi:ribosomal protein L32E